MSDITEDNNTNPFITEDYEEKVERKKSAYEDRAEKARDKSLSLHKQAKSMASVIPLGQPILVGHHSEKRDRNYRERIHNTFDKSFKEDNKADYYENKASSVGTGGIASNDPEAITKLKEKLGTLVKYQEIMKAVNKIIRLKKLSDSEKVNKIVEDKLLTKVQASDILQPDFCGRVGFASYKLQNNNAEINRLKKRIKELESLHKMTPISFDCEDFSIFVDDGRIQINFKHGKPTEEVRKLVKSYAFNWSRFNSTWVRKATLNALLASEILLDRLKSLGSIYG